jgi:hypothetical protein
MSSQKMSSVINAFDLYCENSHMPNDFQEFWAKTWKPISQKCLNIAKHKFIMRKSFELFKAHCVLNELKNGNICFSDVFLESEEIDILQSLCKHVALHGEEFVIFGLLFHKKRCMRYFQNKYIC